MKGRHNRLQKLECDFHKYQALGNDYIVLDPAFFRYPLSENIVRLLCDRHYGIGSDGILYGPLQAQSARHRVQIFNPDGSEAEKSGNGLRIFARYLRDAKYVSDNTFVISTKGGPVSIFLEDTEGSLITVDMGLLSFRSEDIPVTGPSREVVEEEVEAGGCRYTITAATIGNPHCVIFDNVISREKAMAVGPLLEHHALFPNRTNVQLTTVLDRNTIKIEIWERGAGYTLASGSSSCAAAGAAYKTGRCENRVKVEMPGGTIDIQIQPDWSVRMTGKVEGVCAGFFTDDLKRRLGNVHSQVSR